MKQLLLYVPVFLLVNMSAPAGAAEQQQQKKNQAQQIQNSNAPQPSLDNRGVNINNKGGAPKTNDGTSGGNTQANTVSGGGTATSGNYNAPQQSGTPAAPGGTLYDPKSARPNSGAQGAAVTPGDFSRDKQIKDVTDTKGALAEGAPKGGNAITDRANSNPLDSTNMGGPGRGDGRNQVTKRGAASEADTAATTKTRNEGAAEMLRREGGTPTGVWQKDIKEVEYAQKVGPDGYAATKGLSETERKNYWNAQSIIQKSGSKGTPNPESTGGEGPGMKNMVGADKPKKSPAEIEAERKRQITQPNETGATPNRMRADNAAQQTMSGRQSNLINPAVGDGTAAGGFTGTPKRSVQGGTPATKGGVKPDCPPDNPAC